MSFKLGWGDVPDPPPLTGFQSLLPDREPVPVPIQELDPIAATVEKHEQSSLEHVALQVISITLVRPRCTLSAIS